MTSFNVIRKSACFAMILSVLFVGGMAQAALIHHYQAEGNANDSVGSHDGVEGEGVAYAPSMAGLGQAFSFNAEANSSIDTNMATILETGDRTIAFWLKSGADQSTHYGPNGNKSLHVPVSQGHTDKGVTFQFGAFGSPNLVYCCRAGGSGQQILDYDRTSLDWHHVAVTYDDSNDENKIYLNGELANGKSIGGGPQIVETSWISAASSNGNTLRFGTDDEFSNRAYKGLLDDVRIYDHTLSADEVAALVPEPTSYVLIVAGMGMLLAARRRKTGS